MDSRPPYGQKTQTAASALPSSGLLFWSEPESRYASTHALIAHTFLPAPRQAPRAWARRDQQRHNLSPGLDAGALFLRCVVSDDNAARRPHGTRKTFLRRANSSSG